MPDSLRYARPQFSHNDDATFRVGAAWDQHRFHHPGFAGITQFQLGMLTFRKQALRTAFRQQREGLREEPVQRRQRPRGDDIGFAGKAFRERFDALRMDDSRRAGDALSFLQESWLSWYCSRPGERRRQADPQARRRSPSRESRHPNRDRSRYAPPGRGPGAAANRQYDGSRDCGIVEGAIRFVLVCQDSRTSTKRSSRANVSRETRRERERAIPVGGKLRVSLWHRRSWRPGRGASDGPRSASERPGSCRRCGQPGRSYLGGRPASFWRASFERPFRVE